MYSFMCAVGKSEGYFVDSFDFNDEHSSILFEAIELQFVSSLMTLFN